MQKKELKNLKNVFYTLNFFIFLHVETLRKYLRIHYNKV